MAWTPEGNIKGPIGPQGPQGSPGSAFSTVTTAPFTVPAVNANVAIQLSITAGLAGGVTLSIANGAGYYQVVTKDSAVQITAKNLGLAGNASPATVIPTNANVLGTGPQGPVGAQGPQGPQGLTGATGPQGNTGATGLQGPQGPTGVQGIPGAAGAVWWSGNGTPITTNPAAINGDWYLNTANGDVYELVSGTWTLKGNIKGPQGVQGATGAAGPQGVQGVQGNTGNTGATGPQGPKGADSTVPGPTGPQGPIGNTGAQGAQGATGAQGPAGQGVPTGGAINQILRKQSAANYDTVWDSLATAQVVGSNPPGVAGTTVKMVGLGTATYGPFLFTPSFSGKVLVTMTFGIQNDTASATAVASMRYGTGTPPVNNAAAIGTAGPGFVRAGPWGVNQTGAVTLVAVLTGLVVGTQYWFDLALQSGAAGQTTTVTGNYFSVAELP